MAIIPFDPAGGGGGGDVSGDYKFTQNAQGELVLSYKGSPVSSMSPDGSWFTGEISTGVGSVHLGGNAAGGAAHSMSSVGQNVGFKNEFSQAVDGNKLFFYPPWQAVSCNGDTRIPASYRRYTAAKTTTYPNGTNSVSNAVDYNLQQTITASSEIYQVSVKAAEVYTGKLKNVIVSNVSGVEVFNTVLSVVTGIGSTVDVQYKYPFSVRAGDNIQLRLIKSDGSYLKVQGGSTNNSVPWRAVTASPFEDAPIVAVGYGDTKMSYITADHEGWIRLDGRLKSTLTAAQQARATALGFGANLPNTVDRLLAVAGGAYAVGSVGGSNTIARSALPNFTLSGDTGQTSTAHSHNAGDLKTKVNTGNHEHNFAYPLQRTFRYEGNGGSPNSANSMESSVTQGTSGEGKHIHDIEGNTGQMSANETHKHSYTTQSINGGVTQTAHIPAYVALNQFIYLGV